LYSITIKKIRKVNRLDCVVIQQSGHPDKFLAIPPSLLKRKKREDNTGLAFEPDEIITIL